MDFGGPERRRRIGGEIGVARAGGEDHHPALFEVPHGAAADVGLRDLLDLEGGLHAGRNPAPLHRVLQRQRVDDARQHAHVVGAGAVHALGRRADAADDVAAADHDGDLDAHRVDGCQLLGDAADHGRSDAEPGFPGQALSRELDQHPSVRGHEAADSPRR